MRTSLPHGMNQNNRTHPFFIILRKFSTKEEKLFRDNINLLLWSIIIMEPMIFCASMLNGDSWGYLLMIVAGVYLAAIAINLLRWLPKNLIFPKVNRMISSDDYSGAILNYENVINMIGVCNYNTGMLESIRTELLMGDGLSIGWLVLALLRIGIHAVL